MSSVIGIGSAASELKSSCAAQQLGSSARQALGVGALAGVRTVTELAEENGVSRNFVYAQVAKTRGALNEAFTKKDKDDAVLMNLPVTKEFVHKLVLQLMLNGHSSTRGVQRLIEEMFNVWLSQGTIHNILHDATKKATELNKTEDLSAIKVGAHDEIFQAGQAVLVGAEVNSTYCYLLNLTGGHGETEWGVSLLDLVPKGFKPEYTVADFGRGLRAGQAAAMSGVPCHGDVFHVEQEVGELVRLLENRAYSLISSVDKVVAAMERRQRKGKAHDLTPRWEELRAAETAALDLADDVAWLARWFREDVLGLSGPDLQTRGELFDWIVAQLRLREEEASHRIAPLCRKLENNRDTLLGFVGVLDGQVRSLAQEFKVAEETVRAVHQLQSLPAESGQRWNQEAALWKELGERFRPLQEALQQRLKHVVRASSVIENLNSRLRCYFFLRRELGPEYLELLRFFLNHRRFQRSQRADRVGRSPCEILTGRPHAHWLELLGYQHTQCAA
jgi:hypothetical protein